MIQPVSPDDLLRDLLETVASCDPGPLPFRPRQFRLLTAAGLDNGDFTQRYLIPGVLAAGQPGGIYGAFKTLKTSCTADLLLSVATGTPFLGHFPVAESGPAMFMAGESALADLQSMLRRICAARGLSLSQIKNFSLSHDMPRLDSAADVTALRNLIASHNLKVLAIDPAYLAVDLSERGRRLFDMGNLLRPIVDISTQTGCVILIVHHCKHSSLTASQPATLADVAWTGFAEFAAQWILLSRRWPFDPETGQHELWASFGGRAGHSGLWAIDVDEGTQTNQEGRRWQVAVRDAKSARLQSAERIEQQFDERRERKQQRQRQRVIALLSEFPEGETASHLRTHLNLSGDRANQLLSTLIDDGIVERATTIPGRRGAVGYRLTDSWTDHSNWKRPANPIGMDSP